VVEYLIKEGAQVDAKEEDDWTPLHLTAQNGHTAVVEYLLKEGAEVDAKREDDNTLLHLAANGGQLEMAKILIESGANVLARNNHDSVLHTAITGNNLELITLLLNMIKDNVMGDSKQCYDEINVQDIEGDTPLMWAIEYENLLAAELLLDQGVDPNVQNHAGRSALHWAVEKSNLELVQLLLTHKVNPHLKDEQQKTALDLASNESSSNLEEQEKFDTISALLVEVARQPEDPI
jgi:ankyrin repeat protein